MSLARSALGVTTWTLPVRGVEALEWVSAQELGLVHLDRRDVEMYDSPSVLRDAANALDIRLGAVAMYELERVGINDTARARRVIDKDLELAAALGVEYVYIPSFNASEISDHDDLVRTAALLRYALDASGSSTVATENGLGVAEVQELFALVDNERLRLLFDTQNPVLFGIDPSVLARATIPMIGRYVHVKDGVMGEGDAAIGTGLAKVPATIGALCQAGFDGEFVFEGAYRTYGPGRLAADIGGLELALSTCRE